MRSGLYCDPWTGKIYRQRSNSAKTKLAADELTAPLTFAINSCLKNQRFQDKGRRAAACPLDKGEPNRTAEKHFTPVSVLNTFSNIYEKVMKQQLVVYLDTKISVVIGAYRKAYGTQHVLIRLLEDRKTKIDNNYIVGALLMDLPKAFDCIPHDLLIAKLNAYGADENALVLIHSYLKRRKQSVRITQYIQFLSSHFIWGPPRLGARPYSF